MLDFVRVFFLTKHVSWWYINYFQRSLLSGINNLHIVIENVSGIPLTIIEMFLEYH